MFTVNESLEKAVHDLEFSSDDLREALHNANAIEAIILMPIIRKVAEALNDVKSLQDARK
jgi:hypothetical protein